MKKEDEDSYGGVPVGSAGAEPDEPLPGRAELEGLGVVALYLGSDEFQALFA